MAEFITVYEKDSGERRRIPAHWEDVPSLWASFRKTQPPKTTAKKAADTTEKAPATGEKE